ncbi:hypothetical protein Q757_05415 [Oenococcus alcoholitolerans]|uniref:Uncharacterized protein n=1 Tax=Oenococcus alcoholitolerans TaxID=931074 RepID=A0ABR4XRD5_9LACO|nr:hypothetical protein Q757_05415 [Oenococcus alcoholitolerans]
MSQWIDKIEYFTSGSDDEANIISVEINHPQADKDGREKAKLLDNSEIFSPFNEKTKAYDRFLTMTVSEDFLLEAGLELFGRLNSKDKFDLVIFFDKELKGFLPIPLPQLAAFIGQHLQEDQENNEQKFKQPDRKELNRFYKLQSKETEDISNPDLQTALDEGNISNDNINQLIDKAVFWFRQKFSIVVSARTA